MGLRGAARTRREGCTVFQPWPTGGWSVEKAHEICRIFYSLLLIQFGSLFLDQLGTWDWTQGETGGVEQGCVVV